MSELFEKGASRKERLKEIVRDLHEGSDIRGVQKRFGDLIRGVSPEEIAEMEQGLIDEGVSVEQIQKVCDVHAQVFRASLKRRRGPQALPGHPVHTYLEENRALRTITRNLKRLMGKVAKGLKVQTFEQELARLGEIEIHYRRKENQLFPFLEKAGFTGPSKVMWGKHDDVRAGLRELQSAYASKNWGEFKAKGRSLLRAIGKMIFMEEKILFPTSLKKLADDQWAEIRKGEPEIGYAWVKPGSLWDPSFVIARKVAGDLGRSSVSTPPQESSGVDISASIAGVPLDTGTLTGDQINLLLKNLPVDVTYVDENDRVLYYSQGKERVFPRSPGIVGRAVQNCHPPKSVHVVQKILQSFKNKEKDAAEFWLTLNGRFIHIRYFPLYDGAGTYRGVIEVSQDATGIRSLQGERRLLDW